MIKANLKLALIHNHKMEVEVVSYQQDDLRSFQQQQPPQQQPQEQLEGPKVRPTNWIFFCNSSVVRIGLKATCQPLEETENFPLAQ